MYERLKEWDPDVFEKSGSFYYMWAIFKGKISNKDAFSKENIYKTREYVDYIVERLSSKDLLFRLTVLKVIKYLKSRINFDAEKINYWLDKLNPDFLSEEVSY